MAFLIFFREFFNKIDNSKCQNYPHKDCFQIHDIDFLQSKGLLSKGLYFI